MNKKCGSPCSFSIYFEKTSVTLTLCKGITLNTNGESRGNLKVCIHVSLKFISQMIITNINILLLNLPEKDATDMFDFVISVVWPFVSFTVTLSYFLEFSGP